MKRSRRISVAILFQAGAVFTAAFTLSVNADERANETDFMRGTPPPLDARVTKANWFTGPYNRWGLQHVRQIAPTIEISRGDGPVYPLPSTPEPITALQVEDLDGETRTIADWLEASYTDGFLVLYNGNVLAEVYMNSMTKKSYHNYFSMSKSLTGNLAGIFADRGQLDIEAKITDYVPEMVGGAYEGATVRQVLDMTVGIDYSEDYDDPESDVYVYSAAANGTPNPKGLAIYDVLPKLRSGGAHGATFHYVTANTDALGWIVQRASDRHLAELLSTEIWSKLGAERDAYAIADLNGIPWMGGGFNSTLRDAARFGLMMLQDGAINGHQVVPASYIRDIRENAIKTGYPETSYRNHWWVYPRLDAFAAQGVAGQRIMIFPDHDLVIVKLSSWPELSGYHKEGRAYDQRAIDAIIHYVDEQ